MDAVDTTLARLTGIAGQFDGDHPYAVHVGASGSTGESTGRRASTSITLVRAFYDCFLEAPVYGVSDSIVQQV